MKFVNFTVLNFTRDPKKLGYKLLGMASSGSANTVHELIRDAKADVNFRSSGDQETPLLTAIGQQEYGFEVKIANVLALTENLADIEIYNDFIGNNALDLTIDYNNTLLAKHLIMLGADINNHFIYRDRDEITEFYDEFSPYHLKGMTKEITSVIDRVNTHPNRPLQSITVSKYNKYGKVFEAVRQNTKWDSYNCIVYKYYENNKYSINKYNEPLLIRNGNDYKINKLSEICYDSYGGKFDSNSLIDKDWDNNERRIHTDADFEYKEGIVSQKEYDTNDNITLLRQGTKDLINHVTKFTYDQNGRLTEQIIRVKGAIGIIYHKKIKYIEY